MTKEDKHLNIQRACIEAQKVHKREKQIRLKSLSLEKEEITKICKKYKTSYFTVKKIINGE